MVGRDLGRLQPGSEDLGRVSTEQENGQANFTEHTLAYEGKHQRGVREREDFMIFRLPLPQYHFGGTAYPQRKHALGRTMMSIPNYAKPVGDDPWWGCVNCSGARAG